MFMGMASEVNGLLGGKEWDAEIVEVLAPSENNPTFKYRIRIPALHEGLTNEQLPTAIVSKRLFVGASYNVGYHSCPRVGSRVKVVFDGGSDMSVFIVSEPTGKITALEGFTKDDYGYRDQYKNELKVNNAGDFNYTTNHNVNITSDKGALTVKFSGGEINITKDGDISLNATSTATIKSPDIVLDGNVSVSGDVIMSKSLKVSNDANISGISFEAHIHAAGPTMECDGKPVSGETKVPQ